MPDFAVDVEDGFPLGRGESRRGFGVDARMGGDVANLVPDVDEVEEEEEGSVLGNG